jgi:hypothetical protein
MVRIDTVTTMNKNSLTGLTGEFYVLAQLAHRELVGTLTLSNTKGVDILVMNPDTLKVFKLEVKTSHTNLLGDSMFGKNYCWPMGKKHEGIFNENLFYCFVNLHDENTMPDFYIVPSKHVSDHVTDTHQRWLAKGDVKDNDRRRFRIHPDDPKGYQNNWDVFKK